MRHYVSAAILCVLAIVGAVVYKRSSAPTSPKSYKPSPVQPRAAAAIAAAPAAPTPDTTPHQALASFPNSRGILSLSAAPGDDQLVVVSLDPPPGTRPGYNAGIWLINLRTTTPQVSQLVSGTNPEAISSPVWSANSAQIYYQFDDGECSSSHLCGIYDFDLTQAKATQLLDHLTSGLALSPDGLMFAFWDYTAGDQLTVYNFFKKEVVHTWGNQPHHEDDLVVNTMAFALDGKSLLANIYDRGKFPLAEFNIETGEVKQISAHASGPFAASDGVYYIEYGPADPGENEKRSRLMKIASTGADPVEVIQPFPYQTVASSGSPRWVVASSYDTGVLSYDTQTHSTQSAGNKCPQGAVLRDGRAVYVLGKDLIADPHVCGDTPQNSTGGQQ